MKRSMPRRNRSISIANRGRTGKSLPFGEGAKRRTTIVISERESYIVPMIARAIDVSELLLEFRSGLRVKDIQGLTGFSASTIYRILRTLVAFGYVARNLKGVYISNCFLSRNGTASTDQRNEAASLRLG